MKKIIFLAAAMLANGAFASEENYTQTFNQTTNQLTIGPELFWLNLHVPIKDVIVKDTIFCGGIRLGYEYLKPWAFYANLSIFSAASGNHFTASQNGRPLPSACSQGIGASEYCFGYTLAPSNVLLSPYVSLGGYGIGSRSHSRFDEDIVYCATGLRSMWSLNNWTGIGLNAKIFKSVLSEQKYRWDHRHVQNKDRYWGGEISLPIVVHPAKHCDLRFEPYLLDLTFGQTQLAFGSRFLVGWRF